MPREPLITPDAGPRAALRGWLAEDAEHATLAVLHGRYAVKDGLHHMITCALHHARLAKIPDDTAHSVAVEMFWEVLRGHEAWREQAEFRIKRRVKPLIGLRKPSNVLLAEAHGENGAAGFPLAEREVNAIVAAELSWAMPYRGGRRYAR